MWCLFEIYKCTCEIAGSAQDLKILSMASLAQNFESRAHRGFLLVTENGASIWRTFYYIKCKQVAEFFLYANLGSNYKANKTKGRHQSCLKGGIIFSGRQHFDYIIDLGLLAKLNIGLGLYLGNCLWWRMLGQVLAFKIIGYISLG